MRQYFNGSSEVNLPSRGPHLYCSAPSSQSCAMRFCDNGCNVSLKLFLLIGQLWGVPPTPFSKENELPSISEAFTRPSRFLMQLTPPVWAGSSIWHLQLSCRMRQLPTERAPSVARTVQHERGLCQECKPCFHGNVTTI